MLIKCPECELQVSDKALSCPHCGYPLKPESKRRQTRKYNKRRRLPNGFGQISEVKNQNLRNPFRAMVTVGKTPEGKPICKSLKPQAYFPTYNDAYAALVEYNRNPYDLRPDVTVLELYNRWSEEYFKSEKAEITIKGVKAAWKYCSSIYNMPVKEVRIRHIKGCIEKGTAVHNGVVCYPSANTKVKIKSIFNMLFDYAVEYEITDRNYARSFRIASDVTKESRKIKKGHIAFTDDEISLLWEHIDEDPVISVILIQCYSGWRPQELGLIRIEDVDLDNWFFKGGIKTEAGTNRTVPIHSKIRSLVLDKYEEAMALNSSYLFVSTDSRHDFNQPTLTYRNYLNSFMRIRDSLGLNPEHRPHDGRKHFVTMAKKYNVDEYAIKYIVGHKILDITENVYTQRELSWLQDEIEKIR